MKRGLRIVAAEDEPETLSFLEEILKDMGHQIVGTAANGRRLLEICRAERPDLVITDIKMPGIDGIDAARHLYPDLAAAIILVSAHHEQELLLRAEAEYIMAYLIKPIRREHLEAAIPIAMRRFREFQTVKKEASELRQALEDRKLVERAKGIVMKRSGLTEEDAFRRLQELASTKHLKMFEIARMVITMEEAFHDEKGAPDPVRGPAVPERGRKRGEEGGRSPSSPH